MVTLDALEACGISAPAWVLVQGQRRASLAWWDGTRIDGADLDDAWHVRVFNRAGEARWWADAGSWALVEVPLDGIPVAYQLWGEPSVTVPPGGGLVRLRDQRVGALALHLDGVGASAATGRPVLTAVQQLAEDHFGNVYVADEVLTGVTIWTPEGRADD